MSIPEQDLVVRNVWCSDRSGLTESLELEGGGEWMRGMITLKQNQSVVTRIEGERMLLAKRITAPHSSPL